MNYILLGNIVSLAGCVLMVLCSLIKSRKKTIFVQIAMMLTMAFANFILGGYTGAVSNVLSAGRNIIVYRNKYNIYLKVIFCVVLVGFSIYVNDDSWLGWLPVIAVGIYSLLLDIKSDLKLKLVMGIIQIMWIIYDAGMRNYVAFVFDIITTVGCFITIIRIARSHNDNN